MDRTCRCKTLFQTPGVSCMHKIFKYYSMQNIKKGGDIKKCGELQLVGGGGRGGGLDRRACT